jgi:hypothetical protein
MEHSVHIASKHFVEAVAPASPSTVRKKVKAASKQASYDVELAELGIDDWEDGDRRNEEDGDVTDEPDDDSDFTAGDVLGKALALVKQV